MAFLRQPKATLTRNEHQPSGSSFHTQRNVEKHDTPKTITEPGRVDFYLLKDTVAQHNWNTRLYAFNTRDRPPRPLAGTGRPSKELFFINDVEIIVTVYDKLCLVTFQSSTGGSILTNYVMNPDKI